MILLSLPKLPFCACILAFGKWLSPGGKGKSGGVLPSLVRGEAEEKGEIKYSNVGGLRKEFL